MSENVLSLISEAEVTSLLQRLVQIPSVNPPGEEGEAAEYVVDRMREWGLEARLVPEPYSHRPQAVARIRGKEGKPKLVLNGHLDTVPVGEAERWSVDPFSGEVRGERLFGRGSCDMKAGLAAMMIASKAVLDSGTALRGSLILQFAVGEERGEPGTKTLLMDRGYTGDWGIVLEPTKLEVLTAEKGLLWLDVEFLGRPAHASTPELGVNPIEKAASFISSIKKYGRRLEETIHPLLGSGVCTITMLEAGIKENVIPGSCRVTLDRRLLPGESLDGAESEVREILDEMEDRDEDCEGRITRRGEGFEAAEIPSNHYLAGMVMKSVEEVTGRMLQARGAAYGTDARNFINDADIPAVIFGPGDPANAHTYDESVDISQVTDCSKVLAHAIINLLS